METVIFEFAGIYGVSCMCFTKHCKYQCFFGKVVQKHCKIQHFGHVVCESVANSGVFATLVFFCALPKQRKYHGFGSILRPQGDKTWYIALMFCSW